MTDTDSFTLHTTEVSDDEAAPQGTVVFLHGLFGQGRNFSQIAKALQPELRSVLVDLPDHGASDWTESFDYLRIADLVAEELRSGAAADGPVHVVGHSMGGKVAMVLALRHPELVDRLVVVDISPTSGGANGEFDHLLGALADLDLSALERRRDADELLSDPIPNPTVRGFLLQNLRSTDDGFRWRANLSMLHRDLDAVGGFPDDSDLGDAEFDGPVLWVAGSESDYVTEEHDPEMRRLFPNARLISVRDAGHWVHSEKSDVFIAALRRFLRLDG
ncbi:MAG: alpha/beta fold hydrolase [Nesterenkonia sp.]|nr:alpha/beta fold hydrolase [Nesterenkonia sp.]